VYCFSWEGNLPADVTVHPVPRKGFTRLRQYRNYSAYALQAIGKHPRHAVVGFPRMAGLDVHFAADPCFLAKAEKQRAGYYRYTPRYRHFSRAERAVFGEGSHTRVLYLSPQQRNEFSRYYPGCETRLLQLPPGLEQSWRRQQRDQTVREQSRAALGVDPEQYLLLQVGSGFRVKGIDRSLRALAALPEKLRRRCVYIVVGRDRATPFKRLAASLGLASQVQFLGGRDDVAQLMQAADLLLHPAYSESAGYALLEAVVSGLPVLTTASCGYACHVSEAEAGEVCPEPFDQLQLNETLSQMLSGDQLAFWSGNGIAYGQKNELYGMAEHAADLIEAVAGELA
jgi:UDP-glucose:(heptosyl)LPS alpha-1,3-glucosyltransferase